MSLLQTILDEIEAEANKKSAVAIEHAAAINELEQLADTLRKHGALDFSVNPVIHAHYQTEDAQSVTLYIYARTNHQSIIDALHAAEMVYTTEFVPANRYDDQKQVIRIMGMTPHIRLIGYAEQQEKEAA